MVKEPDLSVLVILVKGKSERVGDVKLKTTFLKSAIRSCHIEGGPGGPGGHNGQLYLKLGKIIFNCPKLLSNNFD